MTYYAGSVSEFDAPTSTMASEGPKEMRDNTVIVVCGASGDLAKKKTFPALFGLFRQGFLPRDVHIIGYSRTKMDDAEYHKRITSYIKNTADDQEMATKLEQFKALSSYVAGGYDDDASFRNLNAHLEKIERVYQAKGRHRLFYLALPPSVFTTVATGLKKNCYSPLGIVRIIVEKPFGKDLESSRELLGALKKQFEEKETFRIDHYLGKEMVKNILVTRFANLAFSHGWDKNSISNVQISFKEPFGTEGRGGYFDEFGIIRDVLQNHLMQVLSILTMERPVSFDAEDIRDEKVKVLRAIAPISQDDVLLGQYVSANGKPGYLDDDTVPPNSSCPTFAAVVLYINNPRWEGVPFIMKAGKAWRDFYTHVLAAFPRVSMGRPFNEKYATVKWETDPQMFQAWKDGKTGYPIVDAAMRQLKVHGWMHNRTRMIVAMFLTKDLMIDWRLGEKWFSQQLIDADLASNNGGWQWSASTGTDPQPYFRVFNPTLQSEKADPTGDFIRHFVPELAHVKGKAIHEPVNHLSPVEFKRLGYPKPVVDHKVARDRALRRYKNPGEE